MRHRIAQRLRLGMGGDIGRTAVTQARRRSGANEIGDSAIAHLGAVWEMIPRREQHRCDLDRSGAAADRQKGHGRRPLAGRHRRAAAQQRQQEERRTGTPLAVVRHDILSLSARSASSGAGDRLASLYCQPG